MRRRCAETARKCERKTRCLYPSPIHLKRGENKRFGLSNSIYLQVRTTAGKHNRKQRVPAGSDHVCVCMDIRINKCTTAWWENIRSLMRSLWHQEIHYETRARGASNTAAISSQFYLLSYSIDALTQLEKSLRLWTGYSDWWRGCRTYITEQWAVEIIRASARSPRATDDDDDDDSPEYITH